MQLVKSIKSNNLLLTDVLSPILLSQVGLAAGPKSNCASGHNSSQNLKLTLWESSNRWRKDLCKSVGSLCSHPRLWSDPEEQHGGDSWQGFQVWYQRNGECDGKCQGQEETPQLETRCRNKQNRWNTGNKGYKSLAMIVSVLQTTTEYEQPPLAQAELRGPGGGAFREELTYLFSGMSCK